MSIARRRKHKVTAKRKIWIKAFYLILASGSFIYLGNRLYSFEYWSDIHFLKWDGKSIILLLILIGLWGLNVLFESKKWQFLMRPVLSIPIAQALKHVFIGFSAGCFTPLRLGEAGGKVLTLPKEFRGTGILASFYGSFIKTSVLFFTGISAFIFGWHSGLLPIHFKQSVFNLILVYCSVAVGILLTILFGNRYLMRRLRSGKGQAILSFFQILKKKNSTVIILLTFLRWVTYNLQLYVLFCIFGVVMEWYHFFALSALYFSILTIVPSLFLIDLGIRGSVALAIFSLSVELSIIIIWAIFALWLFNVLLNASIGSLLLLLSKR